jgi:hypothetical protein
MVIIIEIDSDYVCVPDDISSLTGASDKSEVT